MNARNRDAIRGVARGPAVLVVLLERDAELRDAAQPDVLVGDAGDGALRAGDGLYANAVRRV